MFLSKWKKGLFLAMAALTACHSNKTEEAAEVVADTTIGQFCPEGYDALYALQDAPQVMSAKLFEGLNDTLLAKLLPEGGAEASMNVFLLCGQGRNILFDAGVGGALMHNLDSVGVSADQITDICFTHLHYDHIGGLVQGDSAKAVFGNAILHISKAEYDAWTTGALSKGESMVPVVLKSYEGRIDVFTDEVGLPGVKAIAAPGHTPGHTMYDLGSIIIVGDMIHAVALQVEHPEFSAFFDFNPSQASELRKAYLQLSRESHIPLAGMHFPAPYFIML